MYKPLLFILMLFCGCRHSGDELRLKRLQDTLAQIKLMTDFKPLKLADAYVFLNDCYLPRLDTLTTKRKIFIHPLIGTDFKRRFEDTKAEIEIELSGDLDKIKAYHPVNYPPINILFNRKIKWDSLKLKNTKVINDAVFLKMAENYRHRTVEEIEAWHKMFGYGYMCVSYPLYNEYTHKLTITEWIENAGTCGTGRDNTFWFERVGNTWVSLNR